MLFKKIVVVYVPSYDGEEKREFFHASEYKTEGLEFGQFLVTGMRKTEFAQIRTKEGGFVCSLKVEPLVLVYGEEPVDD